jgi:hypothetical protein
VSRVSRNVSDCPGFIGPRGQSAVSIPPLPRRRRGRGTARSVVEGARLDADLAKSAPNPSFETPTGRRAATAPSTAVPAVPLPRPLRDRGGMEAPRASAVHPPNLTTDARRAGSVTQGWPKATAPRRGLSRVSADWPTPSGTLAAKRFLVGSGLGGKSVSLGSVPVFPAATGF